MARPTDLERGSIEERRQGAVYAGLAALLFAGFIVVSRAGFSTVLTLPDIAALRFGVGAALLLPLILEHGFSGLRLGQVATLAGLGGLGFGLLAYTGFALAPASHGGVLIHGTLALTTALLVWGFGLPRSRSGQAIGLMIITAGVLVMALDGGRAPSRWMPAGDACLIGASFCWSGYGLYVKRLGISAVQAAAIVAAVSALVFLPVYLMLPGKMLWEAKWQDILLQALFQGVLIGGCSIFLYTRAVTLLGPERVALVTAAVPSLAMLGGLVLLGEVPSIGALAGIVLVTAGMVTALRLGAPQA